MWIESEPNGTWMPVIDFGISSDAWNNVLGEIERMVVEHGFKRVIEVGGGANPSLSAEFIARNGIEYTLLDVSQVELDKAPGAFVKLCADICQEDFTPARSYDFVFSRMLAEHVSSGERFHRNVRSLLREGGMAFHFFPTLFAPPFVANYLLPERLSEFVLHLVQPGREKSGKVGKFPARYSWCRGPLRSQIRRFEKAGFEVHRYSGFFGHEPYYRKLPPLHRLHLRLSSWLARHPVAALTSFAQVVLVRTAAGAPKPPSVY
jgi:2-polyprenyl-3-methyl-5-hydroxy-6-metoxy-1,4-benzoquinol methylase